MLHYEKLYRSWFYVLFLLFEFLASQPNAVEPWFLKRECQTTPHIQKKFVRTSYVSLPDKTWLEDWEILLPGHWTITFTILRRSLNSFFFNWFASAQGHSSRNVEQGFVLGSPHNSFPYCPIRPRILLHYLLLLLLKQHSLWCRGMIDRHGNAPRATGSIFIEMMGCKVKCMRANWSGSG